MERRKRKKTLLTFALSEDTSSTDFAESKTDRQELIEWWDQSVLRNGRALVVGSGAIGNELLKNLALLGFGYVLACDMDHISASNLSRTVLFEANDLGKQKAPIAVERFLRLNVEPTATGDYFDGDICKSLGTGVFRHVDVVIGCLDNLQTRFEVNRRCNLLGVPFFDAGIDRLNWQLVATCYPKSPCWSCMQSNRTRAAAEKRERHSCDVFKKTEIQLGHAPTVQVSSAAVAALQAQEVIKYLTEKNWSSVPDDEAKQKARPPHVRFGGRYVFDGAQNELSFNPFAENEFCNDHITYDSVKETPIRSDWTLRQLFAYVEEHFGSGYYLSLRDDTRYSPAALITTAFCRCCGQPIDVYISQRILKESDLYCDKCPHIARQLSQGVEKLSFYPTDSERVLDLTLSQLGVPLFHILEFYHNEYDDILALEMTDEMERVMPKLYKRENHVVEQ